MAATAMILNDLEGYSPVAGLFKYNPSNTCAAFYMISTDSVLARSVCIGRASCDITDSIYNNCVWRSRYNAVLVVNISSV